MALSSLITSTLATKACLLLLVSMTGGEPNKAEDDRTRWLLSLAILTKDAAEPLAPIHERNPILLSESSMTEWLDPDNLEDPDNTTQDLLNELANESDEIAGQVEFWPVDVEVGNVRNQHSKLIEQLT